MITRFLQVAFFVVKLFVLCFSVTLKKSIKHNVLEILRSNSKLPLYLSVPRGKFSNLRMYSTLTHVDDFGKVNMVDVGEKKVTRRFAKARGHVFIGPVLVKLILDNNVKKGDVLTVAELAGIMAAKKTAQLIPLCHPLMLSNIKVKLKLNEELQRVEIISEVSCCEKTGVEMEALTAVSIAALTVYDMCKSAVPGDTMSISGIELITKTGGTKSDFCRE